MNKLKLYGLVGLILSLLLITGCRTVDKTKTIEQTKVESSIFEGIDIDSQVATTLIDNDIERQERLLRELVSSLQLSFNGQSENDKLMVELQKTIDGLKFQVSGTGTANYQESETAKFEALKSELFKRQDSLFKLHLKEVSTQFKNHYEKQLKSEKVVQVKGLQFGIYAVLVIGFITFLIGYFISKYLNKYFS
jgi:hypothetical protein